MGNVRFAYKYFHTCICRFMMKHELKNSLCSSFCFFSANQKRTSDDNVKDDHCTERGAKVAKKMYSALSLRTLCMVQVYNMASTQCSSQMRDLFSSLPTPILSAFLGYAHFKFISNPGLLNWIFSTWPRKLLTKDILHFLEILNKMAFLWMK